MSMAKKRKHQLATELLTIVSEDVEPRAVLTTNDATGMPVLQFLDGKTGRLLIGLGPNGSPRVDMARADGRHAIGICLDENEDTRITLYYETGLPAVRI